jgi:hypothetical protein
MSVQVFYVGAQDDDHPLTGFVPAKFLMRNGEYVMDPTPGGSQRAYLYSDGAGSGKTHGSVANPNNYLIVPANYTEQKAKDFAAGITDTLNGVYPEHETGAAGPGRAGEQMTAAFLQRGSQDLQRHPQWGIPEGSVVPAFVGSASNHLGYVTGLAGLPRRWSEIGGGVVNGINALRKLKKDDSGHYSTPIDTGGRYWLSRQNEANITQGYSDGLAASAPPAPFNDYGYGAQPQRKLDQIGDGNGVASWTSSLSGVDPDEPAPSTWPPVADRPIRYLGRRMQ